MTVLQQTIEMANVKAAKISIGMVLERFANDDHSNEKIRPEIGSMGPPGEWQGKEQDHPFRVLALPSILFWYNSHPSFGSGL